MPNLVVLNNDNNKCDTDLLPRGDEEFRAFLCEWQSQKAVGGSLVGLDAIYLGVTAAG